jgi:hypothetical protein
VVKQRARRGSIALHGTAAVPSGSQGHKSQLPTSPPPNTIESRTHRSLKKDAPVHRPIQPLGTITSQPVLSGLHHRYCRSNSRCTQPENSTHPRSKFGLAARARASRRNEARLRVAVPLADARPAHGCSEIRSTARRDRVKARGRHEINYNSQLDRLASLVKP